MNIQINYEPGDNVRFETTNGKKLGEVKIIEINKDGIEYLIDTGKITYAKKENEIENIN